LKHDLTGFVYIEFAVTLVFEKAMADKASGEKAGEKSFFARTAKNTTKRAKRAQEKVI
jgi:hypothetical protein